MSVAAVADYLALTKPKITVYVLMTATLGFMLASDGGPDTVALTVLLVGTALVSGGTNALNMWWEREVIGDGGDAHSRCTRSARSSGPPVVR